MKLTPKPLKKIWFNISVLRINLPPSLLSTRRRILALTSDGPYSFGEPPICRSISHGEMMVLLPYKCHVSLSHIARCPFAWKRPSPKAVWAKPFIALPLTSSTDVNYHLLTSPYHVTIRTTTSSIPYPPLTSLVRKIKFSRKKSFCQLKGKESFLLYFFCKRRSRHAIDQLSSNFSTSCGSQKLHRWARPRQTLHFSVFLPLRHSWKQIEDF